MKHYYRLTPVLWDSIPGNYAATVYSIDRMPLGPLAQNVACTARSLNDPAYWWSGSTFLRLTKPPDLQGCCSGPENTRNAVVWQNLFAWLSHVRGMGYSVDEHCKLDPLKEITLIYEEI